MQAPAGKSSPVSQRWRGGRGGGGVGVHLTHGTERECWFRPHFRRQASILVNTSPSPPPPPPPPPPPALPLHNSSIIALLVARTNDEPFDCSIQSVIQCDLHNDRVFCRVTCGFSRVPEAAFRAGYLRYSFTSSSLWYHHRQVLCSLLRQTVVCFLLEAYP